MSAEISAGPAAAQTAHHGDLPLAAGRGGCRRLADVLRPPDRLPAALPVLRHGLRVPRRRVAHGRAPHRRGARVPRAARLRHRRRAARAARLPDAADRALRGGIPGVARDERRDRHERGGSSASCASSTSRRRAPASRSATSTSACTRSARRDQLKFVICDRADYEWSRERVGDERLDARCQVLFSPSYQQLAGGPARGLDPRRPAAGALPGPAAQGALG